MTDQTLIMLSPYSPLWPATYEMERGQLLGIFGADAVAIEHVGSTAVPGLGGKPIIDIMVGAASLHMIERKIPELTAAGWKYVPEFEKSIPDRRYFTRIDARPGNFHLHAVVIDSPFWKSHLAFRDLLRREDKLAQDYFRLKQRLAARYPNDRAAYTDGKSDFIRDALAKPRG